MADIFDELLDLAQLEKFPSKIQKFLHKGGATYDRTWEGFVGIYSEAFERLAKIVLADWPANSRLALPLFYLARHSIELALKESILEYSKTDDTPPDLDGHGLMQLWNQLLGYMDRWGVPGTDDWGKYCNKLLNHIHEADPDGEQFRYPTSKTGVPFEWTVGEVQEVVRAQWHITMYCDGCSAMHADGYRG